MVFDPFGDDDPLGGDPIEDAFEGDSDGDSDDLAESFDGISRSTLLAFVTVLVLVHVGLFGAGLGAMLIGFRGQWIVGGALVVGGLLALGLAVASYRRYRDRE